MYQSACTTEKAKKSDFAEIVNSLSIWSTESKAPEEYEWAKWAKIHESTSNEYEILSTWCKHDSPFQTTNPLHLPSMRYCSISLKVIWKPIVQWVFPVQISMRCCSPQFSWDAVHHNFCKKSGFRQQCTTSQDLLDFEVKYDSEKNLICWEKNLIFWEKSPIIWEKSLICWEKI